jgi:hypothetical protein
MVPEAPLEQNELGLVPGAGVEQETSDAEEAYARLPDSVSTR